MPERAAIDYHLSRADWVAAGEQVMEASPAWKQAADAARRGQVRAALYAAPVIAGLAAVGIGTSSSTRGMYLEGALAGAAFAAIIVAGVWRLDYTSRLRKHHRARLHATDFGAHVGPHHAEVTPDGVRIITPARELRLSWPAVAVHDLPGYILFQHGGADGTYVPKAAFPTAEAASEFLASAQRWWQEGQVPPLERLTRYLADRDLPCAGCKYNLRGVKTGVCPECGRDLLAQPKT